MFGFGKPSKLWCIEDKIIFPSILIGNALLSIKEHPKIEAMLNNIARFLMQHREQGSVWKHYVQGHPLYKVSPCDIDDTVCASAFLSAMQVSLPPNKNAILSNVEPNGLLYTWFTLRANLNFNATYLRLVLKELAMPIASFKFWNTYSCSRKDVDAVVNANALYYLGDSFNTQPIIDFLISIIQQRQEADCDKWYRNVFTVYYFMSRNYKKGIDKLEAIRQPIINRILKSINPDGCIGNSILDTCLALCTLYNFNSYNEVLASSIQYIIQNQASNGSWVRRRFYYSDAAQSVGWGSEELTTSLCLEALNRYNKIL
ncbi:hypothetical protein GCM10027037_05730 [Mucilaginibacter koreensis]